jgi:transcriptional regulator with PAS, ATPase and Fis domain
MHPIIREFINTNERLTEIISKYFNKDQYLETVFNDLCKASHDEVVAPQMYLDLDKAIIHGHPDTSLYLLFISYSILFTCNRGQIEKGKVLQSVGDSISQENMHTVLRSYYALSKGSLKIYDHQSKEADKLIKESIALIDKKSPRYSTILINMASFISYEGRLNELTQEDFDILNLEENRNFTLVSLSLKIRNCLFTGNAKEGYILIEEYKKKLGSDDTGLTQILYNYLKIMSGEFDENKYDDIQFKNLANAYSSISAGNLSKAAVYAQRLQHENQGYIFNLNLLKYLPLHIELSLKNKGKARLIIQDLALNNNPSYLDDFFWARLQLLEMNSGAAFESFQRLIKNVKKYDAMNRLVFEMQFAKELKASDVVLIMSGHSNKNENIQKKNKKEFQIFSSRFEKGIHLLVGDSFAINNVKELVKKFAKLKEPVMITGETGTGKELVSRAIHEEGEHQSEPFLAINCGALTDSLLQSELFGYVAGAFTGAQRERKGIFEAAGKGTVFLDEFGDISPKLQVSLLRVLESHEIRLIGDSGTRKIECKIIIATNIDLHQAVEAKHFREDLYFRLARFDIKLPPLRERAEDIVKLIDYFLTDNNANQNRKKISKELQDALISYRWPGNIRELKNEIERLKILHPDKELLSSEDFDFSRLQMEGNNKPKIEKETFVKQGASQPSFTPERIVDDQVVKIIQSGFKAEKRLEFIKELFQQYKKLTRIQIIKIMSISPVTATKDLEILCRNGFIEKRTPTKSVNSYYFVLKE